MSPVVHHAPPITPFTVFELAGPLQKLIVMVLIAAAVAALAVLLAKLSGGKRLAGGSAYISGLRLGAPIIGVLGACDSLLNMTLGYANSGGNAPFGVLAPGFAEAFLQTGLGFLVGAVAVFCHWAVESRIDRQVLSA